MYLLVIFFLLNMGYLLSSENPPAFNSCAKREIIESLINKNVRSEDEIIQYHSSGVENKFQSIETSVPELIDIERSENLKFSRLVKPEDCMQEIEKLQLDVSKIVAIFASKDMLIFILQQEIIFWNYYEQKKVRHIYSKNEMSYFKYFFSSSKNKLGYISKAMISDDSSIFVTYHLRIVGNDEYSVLKKIFFLVWDTKSGKILNVIDEANNPSTDRELLGFSKDNSKFIYINKFVDKTYCVEIYNLKQNNSLKLLKYGTLSAENFSLSPDKSKLAMLYTGEIAGLLIIDLNSLECVFLKDETNDAFKHYYSFKWSQDSNDIYFYSYNADNVTLKIRIHKDLKIEVFNDINRWKVLNEIILNEFYYSWDILRILRKMNKS